MSGRTRYDVLRAADDEIIGRVDLTPDEWQRYRFLAEQTRDHVPLKEIPHSLVNLHEHWQHLGPETTAYLH